MLVIGVILSYIYLLLCGTSGLDDNRFVLYNDSGFLFGDSDSLYGSILGYGVQYYRVVL